MRRKITRRVARRVVAVAMLLTCVGLGVTLILGALRENIVFFLVPSDITPTITTDGSDRDKKKDVRGKRIRLGGLVVEGSLMQDSASGEVGFVLTDGRARVAVRYRGILPDLFREGQGVVAIGEVTSLPTTSAELASFRAERVLAKHDEYYMPRGLEKALKKRDLWREQP